MVRDGEDGPENPLHSDSPAAFDDLIESVGPASLLVVVESRMGRVLRERMSPEDVWQEALLEAWRDRRRCEWRGAKAFRSWLLTIVDHRIANLTERESALKKGGGRSPLSLSPGADSESGDYGPREPLASTTPSRLALHREQAGAMRSALEGLPDEFREVVRLRLFEQLSIDEIAGRLGIGASAVRHRFAKGSEIYERRLSAALTSRSSDPRAESAADGRADPSPD
jgi:RNA polymerase sigma-70 factor (ECF subfamily)